MQALRMEHNMRGKYLVQAFWDGMDEETGSIVVKDLESGWNVFDEPCDCTELVKKFCDTVDLFADKYWKERDAI